MPEFLTLVPPDKAVEKFLSHLNQKVGSEEIETKSSLGRVTAKPVIAPHPMPEFSRSTVDGYAVKAADTFGASSTLPSYLKLIDEVPMGDQPNFSIQSLECAVIHTGGMIPDGSDSVIMIEHTQQIHGGEIEILKPVAVGENIIKMGEDIHKGEQVIPAGIQIRPAEIGGLMALGFTRVVVSRKPIVGIISSGDEVIPPNQRPRIGQVRDVNAYSLQALVEETGGDIIHYGIIPDTEDAMFETALKAKQYCDVVVITAGSSASTRDLTSIVVDRLGKPGILVHGVNVKPGKPTILAVCDGKAVIGLPGNPVSALVIARTFVVPAIRFLLGLKKSVFECIVSAKITINLSSQAGREDWVPVKLELKDGEYLATPIFGRSNLIFTLVRADGVVRIPADATGCDFNEMVEVYKL